ncbi:hypothetical protein LWC33_29555 [Pseudonocardia sp. RS11V-5]|uniref:hypothetical protein n=1 Tax=Pseudonocardia terrae TaxID=2905831 RepID=UPI001E2F30C7|nr:hypothetical protein [Pseudonocardia terrae]MCE3555578.1 hypothetical protein [Pseudonocardia terrae]
MTYLAERLLASSNIPEDVLIHIASANASSHDILGGLRRGLGGMTIHVQIPKLAAGTDQGKPCTLGVVSVYNADAAQHGHRHVVLAYAYAWGGARFRTQVYDPNRPGRDDIAMGLNTSGPSRTTVFHHNVDIAHPRQGSPCAVDSIRERSAILGFRGKPSAEAAA